MTVRSTDSPPRPAARILGRRRSGRRIRTRGRPGPSRRMIAALAAGSALWLAPAAQAETVNYRVTDTEPVLMATENPCTGEAVTLTGTHHYEINSRVTTDLSGTRLHSQELHKYSLRGTAALTGAVYQNQQEQMSEVNAIFALQPSGALAPYESTSVMTMLLIRQGDTTRQDDFFTRLISHVTYTANGVPTVGRTTFDLICR